jgi:ComF family protein
MKRATGRALAMNMGRLFAQCRSDALASLRPSLVVPIPMFWVRKLRHGINSPEILAEWVAQAAHAPARNRVLVRKRNTIRQMELPPRERFRNLRNAFRLRLGYDLQGARVLLVDDVLTTGATCSAAAETLKRAGAGFVAVAVLARAEGHTRADPSGRA